MRGRWIFEKQIAANIRGTYLLMAIFILLLSGIVWAIGEIYRPAYAFVLAGGAALITFFMSYYSYYNSDKVVLSLSHARPATKEEYPFLINTLEGLTLAAGLPAVPGAFIIDDSALNAFATGRNPSHAAVAVTSGLLNLLNEREVRGVLAHELAHVRNRDILISSIAAVAAGAVMLLADFARMAAWFGVGSSRDDDDNGGMIGLLVAMIVAPLAAMIIQMAISRSREFVADEYGARLSGNPAALATALKKIEAVCHRVPMETGSPATAHMFILNPFAGSGLIQLFSTHPSTEARVARLMEMHRTGYLLAA
jgi:heat shock protein HtpX